MKITSYSKQQLAEMAKPHFQKLGVNILFATTDGQFFLLENRALLHAAGKNVYKIENENGTSVIEALTINELQKLVDSAAKVDDLRAMMLDEVAGANRADAIQIIDNKINALLEDTEQQKAKVSEKDPAYRGDVTEIKKPVTKAATAKKTPAKTRTKAK